MISIADSFSYKGQKPLDARLKYSTVADMVAVSATDLYDGCLAYVTATKSYYTYDSTNDTDVTLGKWRALEIDIDIDTNPTSGSANAVSSGGVYSALQGKVDNTAIGSANGVASLDPTGRVPSSQLPSYVDDVIEGFYNTTDGKFYEESTYTTEIIGEIGIIYVSIDTNKTYRWSGSVFVEISESLALGETTGTAYEGSKGKANADAITAIKDGVGIDSFGDVESALSDKVDKVAGKGLSTEDYTTADQTKLSGVEAGAEVNVQADWDESDPTSDAYIQNKPTIPAGVVVDNAMSSSSENPVQNKVITAALGNKADTSSLGTAAAKDVPSSGDASTTEVVMGDDSRLTDARTPVAHTHTLSDVTNAGTAAAKDSTTYVSPNNTDLPTSDAVYKAMTSMLEGAFKPAGNKTVAELTSALLVQANVGNVYKITDSGVTDANWVGGAGQTITANQMAVVVYGNTTGTFLFNLENGIDIDLSSYQTKAITPITVDGTSKSNVEDALDAINTLAGSNKTGLGNKADKVSGATSGDFAGLDSNGNLTDSGKKASDFASANDVAAKTDLTNITTVESSTTASKAYEPNDLLILNGQLYKVTSAISSGGTIVTSGAGQNVSETTVEANLGGDVSGKADKVSGATNGNFAGLDSNGNLVDSGKKASDFATPSDLTTLQPKTLDTPLTIGGVSRTTVEAAMGALNTSKMEATTLTINGQASYPYLKITTNDDGSDHISGGAFLLDISNTEGAGREVFIINNQRWANYDTSRPNITRIVGYTAMSAFYCSDNDKEIYVAYSYGSGTVSTYVSIIPLNPGRTATLAKLASLPSGAVSFASYTKDTSSYGIPSTANFYNTGDSASTDLADADYIPFYDSSASAKKKTLWSNVKSKLSTTSITSGGTDLPTSGTVYSYTRPVVVTASGASAPSDTRAVWVYPVS